MSENKFIIRKANKLAKKLRISFSAPSGGGKTMSALLCAYGLTGDWTKIVVIDTERESSSLYADLGEYSTLALDKPYSPERYIDAIKQCENAGFEVVIIDSISHEWMGAGGILQIVESLGGEYRHWKTVTPRHDAFINTILTSKAHVFCTARRKEEYTMTSGSDGKMKVVKLGLKEIQRDDFTYEMDVVFDIEQNHYATASKDRTNLFNINTPRMIDSSIGETLRDWASNGKPIIDDAMDLLRTVTSRKELVMVHKKFPSVHDHADYKKLLAIKNVEYPAPSNKVAESSEEVSNS